MSEVVDRFLKYVSYDTQSKDDVDKLPSTDKQFELARELEKEMREMGLEDVSLSDECYVFGYVPETAPDLPTLGFIAHMDTATEITGANVLPRIVEKYEGGDIYLNPEVSIEEAKFPFLRDYIGQDLIVTDGTTLLGSDDKAGVAEILAMASILMRDKTMRHGRIAIGFTPDEEVGRGPDGFDVKKFGADFAYTVDGGTLGEYEYENFNAASAKLTINGTSIHPGAAKDKMVNAIHVFEEYDAMLPEAERPEHTEGYEGFYHVMHIEGGADKLTASYIIRDHDAEKFEAKKAYMRKAAEFINYRYGEGTLLLSLRDSYRNMKEKILPHMHLIATVDEAMRACGVTPVAKPIRGGTDGATLSYMGLPCPNLSTGGENMHGEREFISVQSMEKMVEVLLAIIETTYKKR